MVEPRAHLVLHRDREELLARYPSFIRLLESERKNSLTYKCIQFLCQISAHLTHNHSKDPLIKIQLFFEFFAFFHPEVMNLKSPKLE